MVTSQIKRDWVVVISASHWYDDLLQNWIFWYSKLSLDMKVMLIAEDQYIFQKYSNDSFLEVISTISIKVSSLIITFKRSPLEHECFRKITLLDQE